MAGKWKPKDEKLGWPRNGTKTKSRMVDRKICDRKMGRRTGRPHKLHGFDEPRAQQHDGAQNRERDEARYNAIVPAWYHVVTPRNVALSGATPMMAKPEQGRNRRVRSSKS
jgi:hypothetical protein